MSLQQLIVANDIALPTDHYQIPIFQIAFPYTILKTTNTGEHEKMLRYHRTDDHYNSIFHKQFL